MTDIKKYRVLLPIAFGGIKDVGEIVEMQVADAENIGIGTRLELVDDNGETVVVETSEVKSEYVEDDKTEEVKTDEVKVDEAKTEETTTTGDTATTGTEEVKTDEVKSDAGATE